MTPTDTRTAILDLAEDLIRSRSFNSVSYQDIAARIGIKKASIHYHFASKEDLGVALVERFRRRAVAWASRLMERNASPREKLEAFFDFQAESLHRGTMICPEGILGAEYNTLPARVQESFDEFVEEQQGWLIRQIGKGQKEGQFATDAEPEVLAALVQSAGQGALQLARSSGRPDRYHAVIGQLRERLFVAGETASPELSEPPSTLATKRAALP